MCGPVPTQKHLIPQSLLFTEAGCESRQSGVARRSSPSGTEVVWIIFYSLSVTRHNTRSMQHILASHQAALELRITVPHASGWKNQQERPYEPAQSPQNIWWESRFLDRPFPHHAGFSITDKKLVTEPYTVRAVSASVQDTQRAQTRTRAEDRELKCRRATRHRTCHFQQI